MLNSSSASIRRPAITRLPINSNTNVDHNTDNDNNLNGHNNTNQDNNQRALSPPTLIIERVHSPNGHNNNTNIIDNNDQYYDNRRNYLLCIIFVILCCCIFIGEYYYDETLHTKSTTNDLSITKNSIDLDEFSLSLTTLQESPEANSKLLVDRSRELVRLLRELNDRELKLLYLTGELNTKNELVNNYRTLINEFKSKQSLINDHQLTILNSAEALFNKTNENIKKNQLKIETITRVVDSEGEHTNSNNLNNNIQVNNGLDKDTISDRLIDSSQNEYILSKPSSATAKVIDIRLVFDLGIVIMASALGGLVASVAQQPILLGYLIGGSVIGPGGLKLIAQFVQVETLAEFGGTFLLFALGVEFNISKLTRVKNIAVFGGTLQLISTIIITILLLTIINYNKTDPDTIIITNSVRELVFIGCILSMSSTTVVIKSLIDQKQLNSITGQVMLGLLIIQDCYLSLILSMLNLATKDVNNLPNEILYLLGKFMLLGVIIVVCMFIWPICLRLLDYSKSHDLFLLGIVALCCALTIITEKIINSAEVGAFLSGILISSSPFNPSFSLHHNDNSNSSNSNINNYSMRVLKLFSPIRDLFGALFFSSIGMLINPSFLLQQYKSILIIVCCVIIVKTFILYIVCRLFNYNNYQSIKIGLSCSQIGEFAFVLASDGLRVGLITKNNYLLLLGVTAVSIFTTPFVFAVAEKCFNPSHGNNSTSNTTHKELLTVNTNLQHHRSVSDNYGYGITPSPTSAIQPDHNTDNTIDLIHTPDKSKEM